MNSINLETWIKRIKLGYSYLVVPLRHPSRVYESYVKVPRVNRSYELFNFQWNAFIDTIDKYNPFYIHVDKEDLREEEIKLLSNELNIKLGKEWNLKYTEAKTYDLDENYLVNKNKKFVKEKFINFYNRTLENV
jgi:hypothetical protein